MIDNEKDFIDKEIEFSERIQKINNRRLMGSLRSPIDSVEPPVYLCEKCGLEDCLHENEGEEHGRDMQSGGVQ